MYKKVIATGSIVSSLFLMATPATFAQTVTPTMRTEQRRPMHRGEHLNMIAEQLGLNVEDIKKELESGKKLPQVLEEHGITKEKMKETFGDREGKMPQKFERALDVIAPKLGLNADEVRAELKAGKTFKEILDAHGITQEQVKANLGEFKHARHPEMLKMHAEVLGMTIEDLQKALDSGQTMDAIVTAHGMTMEQFKEKMHANMKAQFPNIKPQVRIFKQFKQKMAQ